MEHKDLPLLLLDNSSMMSVLNEGSFKCHNMLLEEAKVILEEYDEDDILRCFSNQDILCQVYNINRHFQIHYELCRNCTANGLVFLYDICR